MRIKFQEYNVGRMFPTLLAVTEMTAYKEDDVFKIVFWYGEGKKIILSKVIHDAEEMKQAEHTFEYIQGILATEGYADLIDEACCWDIEREE